MPHEEDRALVDAILGGDRAALSRLVAREHAWLVRLAKAVVRDAAIADEVAQDGWVAVIRALGSWEARSSLRTWMATIVLNRAKTAAVRGARTIAVADLGADALLEEEEDSVDRSRFGGIGFWAKPPQPWNDTPEALLQRRQVLQAVEAALDDLPANQRAVLTLRDIEGWSGEEVCNALGLSESNQRVLLHRARARIRTSLENLLGPESSS